MFGIYDNDKTFIWDFLKRNNLEYYINDISPELVEYFKMMPPVVVNKIYFEYEEFQLLSSVGIELDVNLLNLKRFHANVIKYITRRYKKYKVQI